VGPLTLIFLFAIAWVLLVVILRRWALRRIRSFESFDVLEAEPSGQRISVDGVLLHYVERGRGDPLMLIHGLDASTFTWRMNIQALAEQFRVVAVDLLGFGYSQRAADADYSLSGHARRIGLLMDALGVRSAVIGGHSLGGAVAMHFATQQPERVRRLLLVDAATPRETKAFSRIRYSAFFNPIVYASVVGSRRLHRLLLKRLYYDKTRVTEGVAAGYWAPTRYRGTFAARERLARSMAQDADVPLDAISVPTLILWGANDPIVPPRRGRWLAARIPGARLVAIPRTGHQTPEEQPDIVNREIVAFASKPGLQAASEQR
jgi:pimeloyl-ACP methyl ester carboxylesterase